MSGLVVLAVAWGAATSVDTPTPVQVVELRGRAVCIDVDGTRQECGAGSKRFGLATADEIHAFIPGDAMAAILQDPRVREKELMVRARPRSDGRFEVVKVYSVNSGRLHDIYYFCVVCTITAYAPGLCPCCQDEMELRETPLP